MTPHDGEGEREIRELVEGWVAIIHAGAVEARLASYSPDVVSFDAVEPLRRIGSGSVRERLQAWLASYDGPVGYELATCRLRPPAMSPSAIA